MDINILIFESDKIHLTPADEILAVIFQYYAKSLPFRHPWRNAEQSAR